MLSFRLEFFLQTSIILLSMSSIDIYIGFNNVKTMSIIIILTSLESKKDNLSLPSKELMK
jgi:hypothetical protein